MCPLMATDPSTLTVADLTVTGLQQAFARYADGHAKSSTTRAWSTWNRLCTYLVLAGELIRSVDDRCRWLSGRAYQQNPANCLARSHGRAVTAYFRAGAEGDRPVGCRLGWLVFTRHASPAQLSPPGRPARRPHGRRHKLRDRRRCGSIESGVERSGEVSAEPLAPPTFYCARTSPGPCR